MQKKIFNQEKINVHKKLKRSLKIDATLGVILLGDSCITDKWDFTSR